MGDMVTGVGGNQCPPVAKAPVFLDAPVMAEKEARTKA